MAIKLPIFMDYHSTTPVDPRVIEEMLPYFNEKFGNAASRSHAFGWTAEEAVDYSRERIGKLINAQSEKEIVFTSGATESNNIAIKGVAEFYKEKGNHIITTRHRAQGRARHVQAPREGGLRRDVPRRRQGRPRQSGRREEGADGQDDPRLRHARQQRDRHRPAHRGDRQAHARARRAPPLRRGAGRGQGPVRRPADERRPREHHRAQDVRAEGRRRPLRPPQQAARAPRRADGRRRSRARDALRHAQRPGHRRLRQGGRDHDEGGQGGRRASPRDARAPPRRSSSRRSRRSSSTARSSTACPAT